MNVIAVDLASKYSAAVWMTPFQPVIAEWDSASVTERHFVHALCAAFAFDGDQPPDQLVVEDLPHGVGYRGSVKRVCQIQGRIAERMDELGHLDKLLFVAPVTWRTSYPELRRRGQGMEAVIPIAVELGYIPPDSINLYGPRGGTALAEKVKSDYCAAFLIGMWAMQMYAHHGTFDVPGTNRYGQSTMRKDAQRGEDEEQH